MKGRWTAVACHVSSVILSRILVTCRISHSRYKQAYQSTANMEKPLGAPRVANIMRLASHNVQIFIPQSSFPAQGGLAQCKGQLSATHFVSTRGSAAQPVSLP